MKQFYFFFLTFFISLLYSNQNYAATIYAHADGNWTETTTWAGGVVPGASDFVVIDGFVVTVNTNVTVTRISITNASNDAAKLIVTGADTFTVLEDVIVTAENENKDVELEVNSTAKFIVVGNVNFTRSADNNSGNVLQFYLNENSQTFIEGDFVYDFKKSGNGENGTDILTAGSAMLEVIGKTKLIARDGEELDFKLEGSSEVILHDSLFLLMYGGKRTALTATASSHFQLNGHAYLLNAGGSNHTKLKSGDDGGKMTITGDVIMETIESVDDLDIKLEVKKANAEINIAGDIIMNAADAEEVLIDLKETGTLKLGGDIIQKTNFGALSMASDAKLVFNGTSTQSITTTNLADSGGDEFLYGKILFENSAGISLTGDMVVSDTLFLTTGNIQTDDDAMVIIEEDAVIKGAGRDAFVDGPMMKRGKTDNQPFLFPVGSGDKYAPIEISKITDSALEVTAQYKGDPPPFGVFKLSEMNNISTNQHWILNKSKDEELDVTFHWMNTEENGFEDMGELIVVGLTRKVGEDDEWISYRNGGTTGTAGTTSAGSIVSGDPPPFGVFEFTIGSRTPTNSLPVELTEFHAILQNDIVYLDWQTASEINSSHFIVERSQDGYDYQELSTVESEGDTRMAQKYAIEDRSPFFGNNYYRLKMVDKDGTYEYSRIEIVKIDIMPKFNIFPNPVNDIIKITKEFSTEEDQTIEIYNINGKLLYVNTVSFEDGFFQISTNEIDLPTGGTYFLRISNGTRNQVLKFFKIQ